ncbi:hypothetical protein V8F06_004996 [Rhypophila decipiens]
MAVSGLRHGVFHILTRHILVCLLASITGTSHASPAPQARRSAQNVAGDVWKLAEPTGTRADDRWTHLQQSHRPTDAPRLHGYHHALLGPGGDLRKRELSIVSYDTAPVGSNTCGFFTDDGSPMWCDKGYSCANIDNIRDCCAGDDCKKSSFSSVCLDYTNPACSSYTPGTRCCGHDDPQLAYCATYLWATSANPKEIFTLYECDEKQYAGNYSLWAEKPIYVSDMVPVSTTSRPPLPIPSSPGDNSNTAQGSNSSGSANSGPNVGAIVGGVIGGVALIGIFVLVFYYMRIRGRKAVAAAAEKTRSAEGNGNGHGHGSANMMMHSPPPPSESFWGGSGTGGGGGGDPTTTSTSPATVANSTTAMLTPEQQPLVQHFTPQQMQEWQAFQLYQQQQQQQQQGQWAPPQDPRRDVQEMQAAQQQEETDRGMAMGMAMGMNMMQQGAKEKSPIEMSNSPTSYEVSTASLYRELEADKGKEGLAGRKELPG